MTLEYLSTKSDGLVFQGTNQYSTSQQIINILENSHVIGGNENRIAN